VETGVEALSALERSHYDLVLMDCQMPEMDGFTAAREIRKREVNTGAKLRKPILALTANALQGDRERCLEAGMDNDLKKLIDFNALSTALHQFFTNNPPSKPPTGGTKN